MTINASMIMPSVVRFAGFLLLVTGVLKAVTTLGGAKILAEPDPIFGLPIYALLAVVAVLEIGIGYRALRSPMDRGTLILTFCLGMAISVYRFGLYYLQYSKPCSCLGSLTEILGLSEGEADVIALCILAYVLTAAISGMLLSYRHPVVVGKGSVAA